MSQVQTTSNPIATAESARHALLTMWTIRRFEEAVDDLFARGLMHGTMHLCIGQEASATGACASVHTTATMVETSAADSPVRTRRGWSTRTATSIAQAWTATHRAKITPPTATCFSIPELSSSPALPWSRHARPRAGRRR